MGAERRAAADRGKGEGEKRTETDGMGEQRAVCARGRGSKEGERKVRDG